jgi:hypothetical protein
MFIAHLNPSFADGIHHSHSTVIDLELAQYRSDMVFDRLTADVEFGGYFFVGEAPRNTVQYLYLAAGERGKQNTGLVILGGCQFAELM